MNPHDILCKVISSTNQIFQAEAGSVALLESSGRELVIKAAVGSGAEAVIGLHLPANVGVVGWVVTHSESALVLDATKDDRFFPDVDLKSGFQTKSILCAPLKTGEQTIGAIELLNMSPRYLNEDGLKILSVIADHAALAIENARLVTQTRQQADEQAVLFEAMALHTADLSLDTVLGAVSRQMIEALAANVCVISRWEKPTNQLYAIQSYAMSGFKIPDEMERMLSPSSTQLTVLTSQKSSFVPVQAANLTEAEQKWLNQHDIQSIFMVPLVYRQQTIGLVELGRVSKETATANDLRLAETMAAQAAVAIEHARLYNEATRRLAEARILQEVMVVAASTLDFNQVLSRTIAALHRTLGIEKLGVFLPSNHGKEMIAHPTAIGYPLDNGVLRIPVDDSVVGWVNRTGQPLLLPNLEKVRQFQRNTQETCSEICVPVMRNGQVAAVLNAESSRQNAFNRDELRLFSAIAAELGVALENAHLFEEIKAAEANYHDLFDNANDLIFTLDGRFRVTSANKVALKTTGYRLDEVLGMHVTEFVHPRQIPLLYDLVKESLANIGSPSMFELVILGKTGQEMTLEVTMRVQRLGQRSIELHLIARDVTHRRELEERLRHREKLSSIGKLVAGVAHELNNPLTSIIGYANLLQQSDLPPQYQQDLEVIFKQAERAGLIVKNLLTFTRHIELEPAPTDINETIQASLAYLKTKLHMHNIRVTSSFDFGLPQIVADPHQLEQVFVNLITNAVQALITISDIRQLTISTKLADQSILISIADNGPGIPESIIHRIFDPFFSTKQVGEGTGLGLSICVGIISAHKGRIWVENTQPRGASFYVELPVAPVTKAPLPQSENPTPPPPHPQLEAAPQKILVIDDEEILLTLLRRVLNRMGNQVDTAPNGRIALQKLKAQSYDVVICDILMPDMVGPKLYHQVVQQYPHLANRFLFVTGNTVDPDTRDFLDEIGAPWLGKPFLPADIAQALAQITRPKKTLAP